VTPTRTVVLAVLRKELRVELRSLEAVPAMTLFSVTTFVLFHFGLDRGSVDGDLASGVLWVTLLFAAMLAINRLFVADETEGGFDGFLLAPVDRSALLIAKGLALLCYLLALELVAVPAFSLLLLGPPLWQALPQLLLVLDRRGRHARRRDRRAHAHTRPDRAAARTAAARARRARRFAGKHPAVPAHRGGRRPCALAIDARSL
jgi:hypothetical protein